MRIWLITVGEPLPIDSPDERLLRTGILAETLAGGGHQVTWWTSNFDHVRKRHRVAGNQRQSIQGQYELQLLHGCGYRRNISLNRIRNHRQVAKQFRTVAAAEAAPDLILCSWPTLELCVAAVDYGRRHGVPVVLDVRDMWPNAIVDCFPRLARPIVRAGLRDAYRQAEVAARGATAITGITDGVVDWAVGFADRKRRSSDRAFPMGYRRPVAAEAEKGDHFWELQGLAENPETFVVCFFGAIGRHFEIDTIVAAARQLEKQEVDFRFVLCGDGPQRPEWLEKSANCQSILLPGWVGAAQIRDLMRRSAVGLAPYYSSWDFMLSIPNKPIEYMSAGLPVISSLRGELAELLQQTGAGITYENGDPDDLARVLLDCYDRPAKLDRMSKAATRLFESRFVAESVYSDMADYLLTYVSQERRAA